MHMMELPKSVRALSIFSKLVLALVLATFCTVLWNQRYHRHANHPSSGPVVQGGAVQTEDIHAFLLEEESIENDQRQGIEVKDADDSEKEDIDEEENASHFVTDSSADSVFEPAPRTHKGPYNDITANERYFLYSPSGGFNNQREEVVYAMEIARLLNRTLYVPMAGRHTNFFQSYERLFGPADLFSMDRILDFPYMESYGVKLVPLNTTVTRMVARFAKRAGADKIQILYHPERPSAMEFWHKEDVMAMRSIKHKLLFLRGRGFYHRWFANSVTTKVRKHTRYAPYLRELAKKIVQKTFGNEFYAMHIRLGDYKVKYDSVASFTGGLVKSARARGWKMLKYPVYVATDDPRKTQEDFGPVYSSFTKIVFASDVPKDLVKEFRSLFPKKSEMVGDMMGILEQLICAQALDFVGTPTSTFSAWIAFMRALRGYTYPEVGPIAVLEVDTTLVTASEDIKVAGQDEDGDDER